MAYQVMQDSQGDYYILCDKSYPQYTLVMWSENMFIATECGADDILELRACPELSPSKLAFEWTRKMATWEALGVLIPCLGAKLPGELPPERVYEKKVFKLSDTVKSFDTITLASICETQKWEPQIARRILRKAGLKPDGRWEWDKMDVPKVIQLIAKSYR